MTAELWFLSGFFAGLCFLPVVHAYLDHRSPDRRGATRSVLHQYREGVLSQPQAITLLITVYGFTREAAYALLKDIKPKRD